LGLEADNSLTLGEIPALTVRGGKPLCTFMREAGDPSPDGAELAGDPCRHHNDVHFRWRRQLRKLEEERTELGKIEEADQQRCLLEKADPLSRSFSVFQPP
jgi:hypothetical protein